MLQQSLQGQSMASAHAYIPSNVSVSPQLVTPCLPFSAPLPASQLPPSMQPSSDSSQLFMSDQAVSPSIYAPTISSQAPELTYQPITHHWFYSVVKESKEMWEPFSVADSHTIEEVYRSGKYHV